jgi:hypothetical protein
MKPAKKLSLVANVWFAVVALASHAAAQYAASVVSYSPGTTPAPAFTMAAAALGSPERFSGEGVFPGVVSPFSPPFLNTEIVSVGVGGHLTLRLSNYALPQAVGPEIGVFENFGLVDVVFPNGQAGNPAGGFGPPDSALVEVSENGTSWASLGNVVFDVPANGYADLTDPYSATAGNVPSDFQQPFAGGLASFNGLKYFDAAATDILDVLAGSGGGKWIDISGSGLAQVGFIRFSLPTGGSAGPTLNFEIDGVSVSHAALGGVVVPEPCSLLSLWLAPIGLSMARRRRRAPAYLEESDLRPARRTARRLGPENPPQGLLGRDPLRYQKGRHRQTPRPTCCLSAAASLAHDRSTTRRWQPLNRRSYQSTKMSAMHRHRKVDSHGWRPLVPRPPSWWPSTQPVKFATRSLRQSGFSRTWIAGLPTAPPEAARRAIHNRVDRPRMHSSTIPGHQPPQRLTWQLSGQRRLA